MWCDVGDGILESVMVVGWPSQQILALYNIKEELLADHESVWGCSGVHYHGTFNTLAWLTEL